MPPIRWSTPRCSRSPTATAATPRRPACRSTGPSTTATPAAGQRRTAHGHGQRHGEHHAGQRCLGAGGHRRHGPGLHREPGGHGHHRHGHGQRPGQHQPGQRHDPDHRQLRQRPGRAVLHQHGQHHRHLDRRHRDLDPDRLGHRGQLPGRPAGREVPEHQRQPERADAARSASRPTTARPTATRSRGTSPSRRSTIASVLAAIEGTALAYTENQVGHRHHRHGHGQRLGQYQPGQRHDPDHRQLPERPGRAVLH